MQNQHSDPSYQVHPQLLPHFHLLSSYALPLMQRITLDQVVPWLTQAPHISRELKPMAWTYLNPPPDGSLFLAWQPPRMGPNFASDGYVWLDQEASYRQAFNGFIVEILVHRVGYILNQEQYATHQRMRYRIAQREQHQQAPFDPNFWLVHYGPAEPQLRQQVNRIPIHPQIQNQLRERIWLESQGSLMQRKEFMLMDRVNWPHINPTQRMQPPPQMHPAYQASPMMARPQAHHYPPQAAHPPAAKKARLDSGPARVAQVDRISDDLVAEDMVEYGDYFDTLTPAEISKTRFKQHHEWMEEILSSVYSLSQITPDDLGLGLTGSLKGLTDGIFDAPDPGAVLSLYRSDDQAAPHDREETGKPAVLAAYQKLPDDKMDEFERRIAAFVERGKEDIQAMKKEHAETVAQFNRSKTYMRAERKLRDAKGDGIDGAVQEIETKLHAKVIVQKRLNCVDEGGLEKEDKTRAPVNGNGNGAPSTKANSTTADDTSAAGSHGNGIFDAGDNSAANLLDEFGTGSFANSPAVRVGTPGMSRPQSGVPTPRAAAEPPASSEFLQAVEENETPNDVGLDLLEEMDMDVDMEGLDGAENAEDAEPEHAKSGAEGDWVMVGSEQNASSSSTTTTLPTTVAPNPGGIPPPAQSHPISESASATSLAPPSNAKVPAPPTDLTAQATQPIQSATGPPSTTTSTDVVPAAATTSTTTSRTTTDAVSATEAPASVNTLNEAGASLFDGGDFDDTFGGIDTGDLGLDLGGGDFAHEAFGAGDDDTAA